MSHLRRILLVFLIFLCAGWIYKRWRDRQPEQGLFDLFRPTELSRLDREITDLARQVLPSVVSINTATVKRERLPFFLGYQNRVIPGLGSGVFIGTDGLILTNNHVITGASQIIVITNDQKMHQAEIVGTDPITDIAVIKIVDSEEQFPVLKFADSDKVRTGQTVFAVGNPFGLSGTFTQGIISAAQRRFTDATTNLLQTDTVINPGNSGGPLVNRHGEIVGINVSIYQGDDKVQAWQGIGLAIPSNDARASFDAIMHASPVRTAYLGISLLPRRPNTGINLPFGVIIDQVNPGSPAAAAGMQSGDVILTADGQPVDSPDQLFLLVRSTPIGTTLSFEILRGDRRFTTQATIQARSLD